MSKQISTHELAAILHALALFPEGVALENIIRKLEVSLPRRTMQRRLALLVKEGYIEAIGHTRARLYRLFALEKGFHPIGSFKEVEGKRVLPLSSAAEELHRQVCQPTHARSPVGYCRPFLEEYRPNVSYYLPEKVRTHLLEIGKSPEGKRPAGTYARKIFSRLLIDLSWNSSRLEGNTYSLLETERLLELGETSEDKDVAEAQMILNHKAAIEFMVEGAEQIRFDSDTILNLHALLADNLLLDPRACGSLRSLPVGIGKSVYRPLAMPQLIQELFQHILKVTDAIADPFEQSFFVMVHLPYLQPFLDVNKRVSRLAANIPLLRENLCPLSFVDVPTQMYVSGLLAVYELNQIALLREVFVWAYERSCLLYSAARQELGEPDPFRLRYRELILKTVGEIIQERLNKTDALARIKEKSQAAVPPEERARFVEVIEAQLMGLHRGNIARFRISRSAYDTWLTTWR